MVADRDHLIDHDGRGEVMTETVVFDVDGTLVDTNYQHAVAWFRAFRRHGMTPPVWRIHRAIGMGGDRLVAAVAGDEVERKHGDDVRTAWEEEYDRAFLDEVRPFEGAVELLKEVHGRGVTVVLASSGKAKHVDHYLDLLEARDLAAAWTTSEDAESSKPAPDLVAVALQKVGAQEALMIGDSVWDVEAAANAGLPAVAVRTGGFSVGELEEAGARRVYDSMPELHQDLDALLR
jgi:HAD superfamily hydrolase (TIGR01549 family)